MTRDEIYITPAGGEMNALVAKQVMGWKRGSMGPDLPCWLERKGGWHLVGVDDDWKPSTSISNTWSVVEKIREIRAGFQVICWPSNNEEDWSVSFGNGQQGIEAAQASTFQLAVCRAALCVMLEEEKA
jgi:hypothetical protein